jgi:Tol biopolymer transport system component
MDLNYLVGSAALAAALIAHPGAAADNVVTPAATGQADASAANRGPAAAIETEYVRPLMRVEAGRNDSNPTWSPSGALLAIERSRGDKKEIVIAHPDGSVAEIIYYQLSGETKEKKFFFPGVLDDTSYNAGVTWSPTGDRLAFMSNGGEGNYDLYLRERNGRTLRLTDHKEKDGQAHWSPVGDRLVFVSGRSGKGDIYLLDLATRAVTRLTQGGKPYLYPQWSPDGRKVTMIHGSNENHDIYVIGDVNRPVETLMALTTWRYDDLRPVWSPDGKKIAFYSNYNQDNDLKRWCIIVVAADGSDSLQADALAARVVATDVLPDVERGPAWMPDSARIVYVRNEGREYNPLYIADSVRRTNLLLKADTRINHDVASSRNGLIAFRAQVEQWDQIFIAKLKDKD